MTGRLYALGILGAMVLGGVGYAAWRVDQAEDALTLCEADKRTLGQALDRQGAAVAVWQAQASQARQDARQALAAASLLAKAREPEAKRLEGLLLAAMSRECGPAVAEVRKGLQP